MNVFFVHTPFQILVAQNLIKKKKLENNLLVLSNTGVNAEHYYSIFEEMIIASFWCKKIILGDLNKGIFSFSKPFRTYNNISFFFKRTKEIISAKNIDSIYFGDINHPSYIFLAEFWSSKKKIHFFEEGLSHYSIPIIKKKFKKSFTVLIKKFITDKIVFKRFGIDNFSRYLQTTDDKVDFGFKIEKKFNILPVIENTYDEIVDFEILLPNESQDYLKISKDFVTSKTKKILYLSSTSTSYFNNPILDEVDLIVSFFKELNAKVDETIFLLKFHPKDSEMKKKNILKNLQINNIPFIRITSNLPTEVFFEMLKIDYLLGYGSSSQLYYEMLNPNKPNLNLFHKINNKYKAKGLKNELCEKALKNWNLVFENIFKKSTYIKE